MILHNASSAAFNGRLSQIKLWFNYCGFEETQLPTRNVVFNDMRPSLLRDASVEASPESSHFPVAWPGLTPEGGAVRVWNRVQGHAAKARALETRKPLLPPPPPPATRAARSSPDWLGQAAAASTLALTLADGPRTRATTLSFLVVPSHERERIVTMFLMQR